MLLNCTKSLIKFLLLTLSIFLFTSCAGIFAKSLVYANRQPIIKSPIDYGLEYKTIELKTTDELKLKGWLIPGEKNSIAIMVHPMNFTKYGYSIKNQGQFKITDIEVEFMNTAKSLHNAGHNVLTFDLRNHGESDDSPDRIFTLGVREYNDVIASLDYIHTSPNLKDMEIFFVSFCTGANATIIAMNKEPDKFKNVKCIVAIQPISMDVFVTNFMDDKYPIFNGMIPKIEKKCIEYGGLKFNQMSPLDYTNNIFLPTFYLQVEADKWTDVNYVKEMYENTPQPKEILFIEGEDLHRFDMYNYFGEKPEILLNYIDKYVNI